MEYRKFNHVIVARIDRGEEIIQAILDICQKESIQLANVNALGAVGEFTVGLFNTKEKKYYSNTYTGDFEIVSLTGSLNTMKKEPYTHIHMSVADDKNQVYGGHLNSAKVSATCEMFIYPIDGIVEREFDEEIGLNLYKF